MMYQEVGKEESYREQRGKKIGPGNSLVVQWLGFHALTAKGPTG